jgi:type I restriction enzyme M protein
MSQNCRHIQQITDIFTRMDEAEHSKIFKTTDFGYRKMTVERPLRLNFEASPERIERMKVQTAFQNLAVSKKRDSRAREKEEALGREEQERILRMLRTLPRTLFKDRRDFEAAFDEAAAKADIKLLASLKKAILAALSEHDETAEICEPDPELRDTENVPLLDDIHAYFEREVKAHVPDAWVNTAIRDEKDKEVGRVGYELNFNRYFYKYERPRSLQEIEADIRTLEQEIMQSLREIAG